MGKSYAGKIYIEIACLITFMALFSGCRGRSGADSLESGDHAYKEHYTVKIVSADKGSYASDEAVDRIVNGNITDNAALQDSSISVHKDILYDIYIDDLNISDYAFDENHNYSGVKRLRAQSEDSFYSCLYYEPWDKYIILLDVGPEYAGNKWKHIMEIYLEELSDEWTFANDEDESTACWKLGTDDWQIATRTAGDPRKYDFDFEILKNGIPKKLDIVKRTDEKSGFYGRANVCVGISADDFAQIFNLTYEIDEKRDKGCIFFKRK